MHKLYKHQQLALDKFKDAAWACLNFQMGLGKTLTAILLSKLKGLPTIVICPNTLTDTWRKELTENGVAPTDIWVYRRPEEAKKEEQYRGRFIAWLTS